MKCDELKDYDIMDIEAMDDERLEKSESCKIQVTRVYIKSEVDAAIAELKAIVTTDNSAVIARLEEQLRKTQRALWMTRATALKRLDVDKYIRKHMNSIFWQDGVRTFNEACYSMKAILLVQIRKCHAKAEEYK